MMYKKEVHKNKIRWKVDIIHKRGKLKIEIPKPDMSPQSSGRPGPGIQPEGWTPESGRPGRIQADMARSEIV